MVRKLGRLTVGFVVGAVACILTVGAFAAEDKKPMEISEIMKKGHSKSGLLNKIKEGVKTEKWDTIAEPAKTFKTFGEDLVKNKPEKGDDDSWKKLSEEYKKTTADIAAAVEKKDQKAATVALGKLGQKSCKTCHDAHK